MKRGFGSFQQNKSANIRSMRVKGSSPQPMAARVPRSPYEPHLRRIFTPFLAPEPFVFKHQAPSPLHTNIKREMFRNSLCFQTRGGRGYRQILSTGVPFLGALNGQLMTDNREPGPENQYRGDNGNLL